MSRPRPTFEPWAERIGRELRSGPAAIVRRLAAAFVLCGLTTCGEPAAPAPRIITAPALRELIAEFVGYLPPASFAVEVGAVDDPVASLSGDQIAVVENAGACAGCFTLTRTPDGLVVRGSAPLGIQYGLAEALEAMGYRFFHPWRGVAPPTWELPPPDHAALGEHRPEIAQRGLQVHTLHPIESLFELWVPGPEHLEGALRTVDWLVKNRGNFLQWFALDDIQDVGADVEPWRAHTLAVVESAHRRGVRVGLAVQLFGASNLQHSFDLVENPDPGVDALEPVMRERFGVLAGLGIDHITLAFGEFSGQPPDRFLAFVDRAAQVAREVLPGVTLSASVHVGGGEDLRIDYMGERIIYYFLIRYADPQIVPWVHTVMYFDLFEPAGGAYEHDDFSEHRDYLFERLRTDQPVVYHPESAYWVAFDNPVPMYLPLYMRSRFADLRGIRDVVDAEGLRPLDGHVIFSSGWEWGYWQTDVAALRSSYALPDRWEDPLVESFAVYGEPGRALAAELAALAESQHRTLMEEGLAAYLAGRDAIIELGFTMGIVGQPDRTTVDQVLAMDPVARAAFETDVVHPLGAFASRCEAIDAAVSALELPDDPFVREAQDGVAVDAHRARFVHQLYTAAVLHAAGAAVGEVDAALVQVDAELEAARVVVARRGADLHHPDGATLTGRRVRNPTLYQYGYLREAHLLCFWERERALLRNAVRGEENRVPGCVL